MSELKAYKGDVTIPVYGTIADAQVYLKSEADKVIALLKDKANYNEYAYKIRSKELADTCRFYEKELRHQKYKRCLAMAKWCRSRTCFYDTMREGSLYWAWKSDKAYKWHKRWLELAEKFKEAK